MSVKNLYPNLSPSLLLDFASTKKLDPRITFVRTTTATVYDGKTTAKAEENLLIRSQEFETTWVAGGASRTANTEVAPDGTTTADTLTAVVGTGQHIISQVSQSVAGTQRVLSCFVKAGTNNYFQLMFGTDVQAYANFDVTAGSGAVGTVGSSATASIVDAGNGWYRCIVTTSSATASATAFLVLVTSDTAARFESWTAAGTETVFLWGAQLEQRSAVTAYTPTTTQAITNYVPVLQTAASGVARFDHNPLTGESLGLLVEEQRTNLHTHSEDLSNAAWVKARVTITTNTIVAPDGTLTGDKAVENTDNNTHIVQLQDGGVTVTSGTTYTYSVYAKAGGRNFVKVEFGVDNSAFSISSATFNLTTGAIDATSGSGGTFTITAVGNDWYRLTATSTAAATAVVGVVRMYIHTDLNTGSYTGDGYSGIYIWGGQQEAGAFPTSYIPTVAASVTRIADVASMTGTNFSSWYRQDEGTLYTESVATRQVAEAGTGIALLAGSSGNLMVTFYRATGATLFIAVNNSVTQAELSPTDVLSANVAAKIATAFRVNDFASSGNGGAVLTDTFGTIPTITHLDLGTHTKRLNGYLRKLSFYPARLSNAQLQALTTV